MLRRATCRCDRSRCCSLWNTPRSCTGCASSAGAAKSTAGAAPEASNNARIRRSPSWAPSRSVISIPQPQSSTFCLSTINAAGLCEHFCGSSSGVEGAQTCAGRARVVKTARPRARSGSKGPADEPFGRVRSGSTPDATLLSLAGVRAGAWRRPGCSAHAFCANSVACAALACPALICPALSWPFLRPCTECRSCRYRRSRPPPGLRSRSLAGRSW